MKERLASAAFSLTGLSLAVGALGFLSGLVQLFVDTTTQLSIKWLLLAIWLSLTVGLILLKVIFDLHNEKRPSPPFETPIKYLPEQKILVIRRNDNFLNNIVVGCYMQQDEVDTLAAIGVVHIVQEKIIQVQLIGDFLTQPSSPASFETLAKLVVRPVVPFDALNHLAGKGA